MSDLINDAMFTICGITIGICLTLLMYTPGFTFEDNNYQTGTYQYANATDNYYCVWTGGRTAKQIATTDQHEICHAIGFNHE